MHEFDVAIIGSGPAAVASLAALDASYRIAVVTGAAPSATSSAQLHPKILSVATERGETAGLAEPFGIAPERKKKLFSTAAVGGLANYWGQQFVRFSNGDPWPADVFPDYSAYEDACATIESLFTLEGSAVVDTDLRKATGFRASIPRLLAGAADRSGAGLESMRYVYRALEARTGAIAIEKRARSFARQPRGWRVLLEGGEAIHARRIILAAGVIGNARIILRSYPDLERARFRDHSPWMLYVYGLGSLLRHAPSSKLRHFNALTLEQVESDRCQMFASVYDLRQFDLNLLMASTVGWTSRLLRRRSAPLGASIIKPVQIWTAMTEDIIELDARSGEATAPSRTPDDASPDPDLALLRRLLESSGGKVLGTSRTKPGFGFHYHGLEFTSGRESPVSIADLLRERTEGGVLCLDASILSTIGLRPHTLTAMATGHRLLRSALPEFSASFQIQSGLR